MSLLRKQLVHAGLELEANPAVPTWTLFPHTTCPTVMCHQGLSHLWNCFSEWSFHLCFLWRPLFWCVQYVNCCFPFSFPYCSHSLLIFHINPFSILKFAPSTPSTPNPSVYFSRSPIICPVRRPKEIQHTCWKFGAPHVFPYFLPDTYMLYTNGQVFLYRTR